MKTTLLSLVGLVALTSAPVFADVGQVKALIFTSQSQLNIDGLEARGGSVTAGGDFTADQAEGDKLNSIGGGVAFEVRLANQMYLGTQVGYINYDGEDEQGGYSDLVASGYGALDFWSNDVAGVYGKAGLSYHRLTLENFNNGALKVEGDAANLGNYDAGVGARWKLNYATTLGLEYKYTDTFARSDVDLDVEGAGVSYSGLKYKDIGITNNEAQASLGFVF
ncbi:MAG TPA: outer membrane beta-barrel protein [Oligoflexus sp.]|uniref:outer membrane beta-barrel protein n=1 Tax=Oligoflexus sp. TaxID=1971216 RepID=UPI002D75215F|nr:outer membrane beta-barrel protein [Oligoflexus sp.]HYX39060.1 outer membrane beta-barrel protein [Oligoflexus sp.]